MLKLFILFILSLNIYADNVFEIVEDFSSTNSAGYIYYTLDVNKTFTPEKILSSKKLALAKKLHYAGIKGPFWTKFKLKNSSSEEKVLTVFNPHAGTNKIDVYIYKDSQLIKHRLSEIWLT